MPGRLGSRDHAPESAAALALVQWLLTQILTVDFQQVEQPEHHVAAGNPTAVERSKVWNAGCIGGDEFAIENR